MKPKNWRLAVIIPAHNEAAIIGHNLARLTAVISSSHIYVVCDGCTDRTSVIAKRYTPNVLILPVNQGKGQAINLCLDHYSLTRRYRFIMPLDADTFLDSHFFDRLFPHFRKTHNQTIAAVTGRVTSLPGNWLSAYRLWEYDLGQTIHKQAQSYLGGITVCPGCSTVYRARIFNRLRYPARSLAEDMDLTYSIHRLALGKITFAPQAIVYTQDPQKISDFLRQLKRWYLGFWASVVKHHLPWGGQMLDLEVSLSALEGLFSGLLIVTYFFIAPFSLRIDWHLLAVPIILDLGLFFLPSLLYVSVKHHYRRLLLYAPLFYFLRLLSSLIFLISFIQVMLSLDRLVAWFSPRRYQLKA